MNVNKLQFIDLGLPSGKLWATENIKDEDGNEAYVSFDKAIETFGDKLPTKEDWKELFEHCIHQYDEERKGIVLTGPNGNAIFLPCYELKINVFEYLLELFIGAKDGQPISDLDYKKSHLFENVLKDLLGESCFEPSKFGPYLIDKYAGKRDAALSGGADATLREWILPYAAELAFKFHYDQYNSLTKESYILLLYYKIKYFGRDIGVDDEWLEAEGITI